MLGKHIFQKSSQTYNSRVLFSTIDKLLNPCATSEPPASPQKCEELANYFSNKIISIRNNIPTSASDHLSPQSNRKNIMNNFNSITLEELKQIVSKIKPSYYMFDPIPATLFKNVLTVSHPLSCR